MLATWGCATFPKPTLDLDFSGATSLDSRITFSRATKAWYFNSAGVLTQADDNAPRFDYNPSTLAPRGLLIEEQRTNSIRNNTMQGAVAGTPGTAPTNWSSTNIGLTREIVGTGTENGITYIDVKFSGTTTGQFGNVTFEGNSSVAASASQSWTNSAYIKIVAGSTTNLSQVGVVLYYFNSTPTFLSSSTAAATLTSTLTRFALTATTPATTAFVQPGIYFNTTAASGQAIDITLRIGLPQLELGAFATSVIPTTTTALTRNADVASMTGTNFSSWYNAVEGTLLVNFASVGAMISNRAVVSVNDGTTGNYVAIGTRNGSAVYGSTLRSAAGTVYQIGSFGASDTADKKAIIGFKNSDQGVTFSGAAAATDTQTIPTVNQLTIGTGTSASASTIQTSTWISRIAYYPARLPNATLQALTA